MSSIPIPHVPSSFSVATDNQVGPPAGSFFGIGSSRQGGYPGPASALAFSGAGMASDEVYIGADDEPPRGMPLFGPIGSETAVSRHFGASYGLLERQRPDVASLARFAHRVELATFHMCVAFELAGIHDFDAQAERSTLRGGAKLTWFALLVETTFSRFRVLRQALMYDWTPPTEVEPLTYSAFHSLCDLTPASSHTLKQLFFTRREHALKSLVKQLDATAGLIEDALTLRRDLEGVTHIKKEEEDANRLAANQEAVLSRAGEPLGLRQAAERLGMSHQNLHKRIGSGSALGVMQDRELIVPSVQFVGTPGAEKIVPELRRVLSIFEESHAGSWSALQYLTEHDPSLGMVPIEVMKTGSVDAVVHAARSYLGLDES